MRRADRLFELVQRVRGRRLSTAEQLAGWLQVSVRTVYRDVADLQARGVPIEGEAGVGYRLRAGYTLPPLSKILAVLPADARAAAESLALYAPDLGIAPEVRETLEAMRHAVVAHLKLRLTYADEQGRRSERLVRPLGCFFWGATWTLAAWCELRQDFRSFRIDRVHAFEATALRFRDEPGRSLADLLRRYEADAEALRHRGTGRRHPTMRA